MNLIISLLYLLVAFTYGKITTKTEHETFYGFTAFKEVTQEYGVGDRILFEGVMINYGYAYQPELSQFTCPVSGVYYVSVNLMADFKGMRARVVVGDDDGGVLHVWSNEYNGQNTASNSGIVYCEAGMVIYVLGDWDSSKMFGHQLLPYTTFTIMLLSQDDDDAHNPLKGFSVANIQDQLYSTQEVIQYSEIQYDDGNYRSDINGYYCNISGVYFVNFNNHASSTQYLQLGIEKSNVMILHAQDVSTMNSYNEISNSRLVLCEAGEFMMVKGLGDGAVYGDPFLFRTTFNGFLLKAIDADITHENIIGFSVFKILPQSYNTGEVIRFTGILWDEDNSYDPVLNRFECPVTGIYYISVTFKRNGAEPLYVQVLHQSLVDAKPVLMSEEDSSENQWNTISNSGLVFCFKGDSLQVRSTGTGSVYGDSTDILTTFTAFLMYQE